MKENLNEQLETTAKLLAQLEAEQADLSNRMTLAVNDADSSSMISLRHRADELPIEIQMTKIRLERLKLQLDEEKLPELQAEVEKLFVPMEKARIEYEEAGKVLGIASGNYSNAFENVRERKLTISERKRTIENLIYEKSAPALRQSLLMSGAR